MVERVVSLADDAIAVAQPYLPCVIRAVNVGRNSAHLPADELGAEYQYLREFGLRECYLCLGYHSSFVFVENLLCYLLAIGQIIAVFLASLLGFADDITSCSPCFLALGVGVQDNRVFVPFGVAPFVGGGRVVRALNVRALDKRVALACVGLFVDLLCAHAHGCREQGDADC